MSDERKVSFANDIAPIFKQYAAQMKWRFDLTSYEDVKTNYGAILNRVENKGMPPPPFKPLTDFEIENFRLWKKQYFPP